MSVNTTLGAGTEKSTILPGASIGRLEKAVLRLAFLVEQGKISRRMGKDRERDITPLYREFVALEKTLGIMLEKS